MLFYTRSYLCTFRYSRPLNLVRLCDFCRYICLSVAPNSHQNENVKIIPEDNASKQRKYKKLHNRPKCFETENYDFSIDLAPEDTFGLLSRKRQAKKIPADDKCKTQTVHQHERLSLSDDMTSVLRKQTVDGHSSQTSPEVQAMRKSSTKYVKHAAVDTRSADVFGTLTEDVIPEEDLSDSDKDEPHRYRPLTGNKQVANWYGRQIEKLGKKWKVKEAIDVLEQDMLVQDRVMPNSYVFSSLLGILGRAGYTKKAFKLFNKMKKMGIKPDETMYTSLFNACANSPWPEDGLTRAHKLYSLMTEQGVQPNLINYKAMMKAFGVCGDLRMAFRVMDELCESYRPDTECFSFLLMACVSDHNAGFRHAIQVWRLMKRYRVHPDLPLYNLLLRVVRDCAFNRQQALETSEKRPLLKQRIQHTELVQNQNISISNQKMTLDVSANHRKTDVSEDHSTSDHVSEDVKIISNVSGDFETSDVISGDYKTSATLSENVEVSSDQTTPYDHGDLESTQSRSSSDASISDNDSWWEDKTLYDDDVSKSHSLISVTQNLDVGWTDLPDSSSLNSAESRLALLGGVRGWLRGMDEDAVQPDVKTFMQLLDFPSSMETEQELLSLMERHDVKPDTDLLNNLIHKRCMRHDLKAARDVVQLLERYGLQANMRTYCCLAMTCRKRSEGRQLLTDMEKANLEPNIEVLGTLVFASHMDFHYKLDIIKLCEKLSLKPNAKFLEHTERSIASAKAALVKLEKGELMDKYFSSDYFQSGFKEFMLYYRPWLQRTKLLIPSHPWKPFQHEKTEE